MNENGNIKLTEILVESLRFSADPTDSDTLKKVQSLIESLQVKERLPLLDKEKAIIDIVAAAWSDDRDPFECAMKLEAAKIFYGLAQYATNLDMDLSPEYMTPYAVDVLEGMGFSDYLLGFCGKDYAKLESMISEAVEFSNVFRIVNAFDLIDPKNIQELKDAISSVKNDLTPERIKELSALAAVGEPAWEALKQTLGNDIAAKVMERDVSQIGEMPKKENDDGKPRDE